MKKSTTKTFLLGLLITCTLVLQSQQNFYVNCFPQSTPQHQSFKEYLSVTTQTFLNNDNPPTTYTVSSYVRDTIYVANQDSVEILGSYLKTAYWANPITVIVTIRTYTNGVVDNDYTENAVYTNTQVTSNTAIKFKYVKQTGLQLCTINSAGRLFYVFIKEGVGKTPVDWVGINAYILDNNSIYAYPNPAKDIINFSISNESVKTIFIYNSFGQLMTTSYLNNILLDEYFEKGIYIAEIHSRNSTKTKRVKFVKE